MTVTSPPDSLPEIVYHYTNSAGLLGILSNREIWLGDVEFMNDAEELLYARSAVVPDLEIRARALWPTDDVDPEQSAEWCRSQIIRTIITFLTRTFGDRLATVTYHAYAACFCEDPDLLSQWRGYAGEGGYAVGFRTDLLGQVTANQEPGGPVCGRFAKVHYGLDSAKNLLDEVIGSVALYANAHWPTVAWHQFMHNVLPAVAAIKHPSFAEEQEWRLLQCYWGIDKGLAFRAGRIGPVPFRKLPLPAGSIADIIVGPGYHPDVRRASVLQLLDKLDLGDVEVRASKSPLRP